MKKLFLIILALLVLCSSSAFAVSATVEPTAMAYTMTYDYQPPTEMENPPLVVMDITSREQLDSIKDDDTPPQYALFTIASVRDNIMVTINGSSFTVEEIFAACHGKTVPVFNLSDIQPSAPENLCATAVNEGYIGFVVVSKQTQILNYFASYKDSWALEIGLIADSADLTAITAATSCGASFIFTPSASNQQVADAAQSNLSVMLKGQQDSEQAMQDAIDAGAKWVVVSDHVAAYNKLSPFAEPPHMPDLPVITLLGLSDLLVPVAAVLLVGSVLIAVFYRKRR